MVTNKRKDDVMARFLNRRPHLLRVAAAALICCLAGFAYCATGFSAPAPTPEAANLSTQEKQELVNRAVAAYERGQWPSAQRDLERARTVFPENYAIPYYLGLIYLEQGRRSEAIVQWQRYVAMDPKSENALKIRKNLTLLLRQEARESAKRAVTDQATLIRGRADDKTIAVTSFSNLGSENLGPLGKGMAAMLISDLSKVPDLKVVDRIKLQALLDEMKLGTSGLVDSRSAPKVGKLLKARHVTSGSLADLDTESLVIASVVVDSHQRAGLISSQNAQGVLTEFYDLEKKIACQIIQALGKNCETVPEGFYIIHTKSLPALVLYSKGLDEFDRENYDEARELFQQSLDEDPKFDLALAALLATPTSAMLLMDDSQMASAAASSGPSSATAGTAVASSAAGSGASTASASAGVMGLSTTTLTVGGAAVVGAVALAGGGGGGSGPDAPAPSGPAAVTDLSGTWRGTWTDTTDGTSAEAILTLTQTDSSVSGTVSVSGDACLPAGNVTGSISANGANLTITSGSERVTLNATADLTALTLNGTWDYTASASEICLGDSGNFTGALTGGADIHW
jgi:TolB-like protein/outer membrane protein assembly factor BamD (BamD/ComL family)